VRISDLISLPVEKTADIIELKPAVPTHKHAPEHNPSTTKIKITITTILTFFDIDKKLNN
jgi:hypothetical protein